MTDETIFTTALEKHDPTERCAYLAQTCADDPERRKRIEALLAAHARAVSFLERPAVARPDLSQLGTQSLGPNGGTPANDDELSLAFLAPPTRPDSLGRIGHYEVLQVLGQGGFGIVFRAFDDVLQRVVAVKALSPHIAATSPARKRFLREARSSAAIRHENVVQVHEVAEQPLPYLVMEFIPGETLQHRLDHTGPLDLRECLRIARQIAEGLSAAHAQGLIHRDIKPGNILLEAGPHTRAKLTDFGLARTTDDASISQSGIVAGTPSYMAPEQAKGESLDHRADLFSLGSVLYTMIAGHPPFRANNTLAVLERVVEDSPRPLREIIPETPEWLCRVVAKLHEKAPADRYQSAREVADVLADCEQQVQAHGNLQDYSRIPTSKPVRRSRNRWWLGGAGAALVSIVLSIWLGPTVWLFQSDHGELEILPEEGLVSVIVLQNDEGVIDGNKLLPMVTDWLSMKQPQTVRVKPGKYQLNVGTYPAGTVLSGWDVTSSSAWSSEHVIIPVMNSSAIITVPRGNRVTLRPRVRTVREPAGGVR